MSEHDDGMARTIVCEGCGRSVQVAKTGNPMQMREQSFSPAPGRVSITHGHRVVHQCADREYLPPDQIAPPREATSA